MIHHFECYLLANSNVEISCHLVDIEMSMDPAGTQGSGAVLTAGGNLSNQRNRTFIHLPTKHR